MSTETRREEIERLLRTGMVLADEEIKQLEATVERVRHQVRQLLKERDEFRGRALRAEDKAKNNVPDLLRAAQALLDGVTNANWIGVAGSPRERDIRGQLVRTLRAQITKVERS
jgi:hypothetical protein